VRDHERRIRRLEEQAGTGDCPECAEVRIRVRQAGDPPAPDYTTCTRCGTRSKTIRIGYPE